MIKASEIKILLRALGLKQKWVAVQIGLTEGSFKQVMGGRTYLKRDKAIVLARILNVKLIDIWEDV